MKILLLDIETFPHLAAVWGLFKENIPLDRLMESGYTACWAAKWRGENHVYFDSVHRNTRKGMVENVHELLDEADAVVHYNGSRFDLPTLNKEFLQYGLQPPSPYKQVDLLNTARKQFRFASNKLDFVSKFLGVGQKTKHRGYDLWKGCMDGDRKCWTEMREYNCQDVILLENLYDRLLPWIQSHPNHGLHTHGTVCTNCGSKHVQRRGISRTGVGVYQRWQCTDCGTWMRTRKQEKGHNQENLLVKER